MLTKMEPNETTEVHLGDSECEIMIRKNHTSKRIKTIDGVFDQLYNSRPAMVTMALVLGSSPLDIVKTFATSLRSYSREGAFIIIAEFVQDNNVLPGPRNFF